jgi:hypothetical protein
MKTILLAMLLAFTACVDTLDTDEPAAATELEPAPASDPAPRTCSTDAMARPAIAELPAPDARTRRGELKAAELGARTRPEWSWDGPPPPPRAETARSLDEYLARSANLDAAARTALKHELLAR